VTRWEGLGPLVILERVEVVEELSGVARGIALVDADGVVDAEMLSAVVLAGVALEVLGSELVFTD
jgi:pentose-5-phosphate-3-epimerase